VYVYMLCRSTNIILTDRVNVYEITLHTHPLHIPKYRSRYFGMWRCKTKRQPTVVMSLGRVWYYLIVDWRAAVPRSGRVGPTSKRRVSTSPLKFYEELKSSASAGFESRNDDCQDFYFDNYIPADSKDEAGVICLILQ